MSSLVKAVCMSSAVIIMFMLSISFWSFMFYLVYDHLLPIWNNDLPVITFPTYIGVGLILAVVSRIFKK